MYLQSIAKQCQVPELVLHGVRFRGLFSPADCDLAVAVTEWDRMMTK